MKSTVARAAAVLVTAAMLIAVPATGALASAAAKTKVPPKNDPCLGITASQVAQLAPPGTAVKLTIDKKTIKTIGACRMASPDMQVLIGTGEPGMTLARGQELLAVDHSPSASDLSGPPAGWQGWSYANAYNAKVAELRSTGKPAFLSVEVGQQQSGVPLTAEQIGLFAQQIAALVQAKV